MYEMQAQHTRIISANVITNPGHNATGQNAADKNNPGQNAARKKKCHWRGHCTFASLC